MSKQCIVCKKKFGMISAPFKISDGYICKNCLRTIVPEALGFNSPLTIMQNLKVTQMSTATILEKVEAFKKSPQNNEITNNENSSEIIVNNTESKKESDLVKKPDEEFDIDRAIDVGGLTADFTSKIVMTSFRGIFSTNQKLYYFKDITGYKPSIEGREIKKHHGITRAATGGILFGGAGAIVGALTGGKEYDVINKISITVFLSSGETFGASFLSEEKKADSWTVKNAKQQLDQWCNLLDRIINDNQSSNNDQDIASSTVSNADEIRKYKSLLDDGIITQEEFDKKKAELLN